MATHFSSHAWKIQWTEETGGLQSMGCKESDTDEHAQTPKEEPTEQWLKNWGMWEKTHTAGSRR